MTRRFNDTGLCIPSKHFMVDMSAKIASAVGFVQDGLYFCVNRPRQYGKTTLLDQLDRALAATGFLSISLSFEGVGDSMFQAESAFCSQFPEMLLKEVRRVSTDLATAMCPSPPAVKWEELSLWISRLCELSGKPVALQIDEVDKSSNNQLFLYFLGMLRNKYLDRERGKDKTFQSVVLAGVHDVKSMKLKIRPDAEAKFNSPWNIAADYTVPFDFTSPEIGTMLSQYAAEREVAMDIPAVADRLHYYTSGHPWLTSKMCKIVDELMPLRPKDRWTVDDIDAAFASLTRPSYTTTNFDDLAKNLQAHDDLSALVYSVIYGTQEGGVAFSALDPLINLGLLFGVLREESGKTVVHNRVYEQILADYYRSRRETSNLNFQVRFHDTKFEVDGTLDMAAVLSAFQRFMKEHTSWRDANFLEREGRLLFLSFLKPILNGRGFAFKEPVCGDERRIDVALTYGQRQKEVVELKIWRGDSYHETGLRQLADYLDTHALDHGYLVIFDLRKKKRARRTEQISAHGKNILTAWI